jgi:hypothetical protein
MSEKTISKMKLLATFSTATLIFIIGIVIGSAITNQKFEQLNTLEQDIKTNTMALELQYDILQQDPCSALQSSALTEELYRLSDKLGFMENQLGLNDPTVLRLKEYYSLLELRHWLFLRNTREQCRHNSTTILYFYSNKGDCKTCEEQGFVLTYIRRKFSDVQVYPLDINMDNVALNTIKNLYITKMESPILVINDETYYGFKDSDALEAIIGAT